VASAIKNTGGSEIGVQILGPIHGLLFLTYIWMALTLRPQTGWSGKTTVLICLGAVLPFGGYVVDRWLSKQPPATPVRQPQGWAARSTAHGPEGPRRPPGKRDRGRIPRHSRGLGTSVRGAR